MNYYRKYIILIAIISAILGIIIAFVYFLNSFQLLEVKPILLSQMNIGDIQKITILEKQSMIILRPLISII